MRKVLVSLPDTQTISSPNVREFSDSLNFEIDSLVRNLNKYVDTVVSSTYDGDGTLTADDELVLASGTITITLPPVASSPGKSYHIKNTSTGVITVDGNGATIDDEDTQTVNQFECMDIVSDGTEWNVV